MEIQMELSRVLITELGGDQLIFLREKGGERTFPIVIGIVEIFAIDRRLKGIQPPRPMTHDLLKNAFTLLNGKILRVEIVSLKEDTYYGNIVVEADEKIINIDARPSDAIALAVRAHVPILVSQAVMDEAGIVPENNLQEENPSELVEKPAGDTDAGPEDVKRLDVFEDFLKKLGPYKGDEEKPKP